MKDIILSIAIPTYNRGSDLRRLLMALIEEIDGVSGVELIVCNNASTDDTGNVLHEVGQVFKGLVVFNNKENLGMDGNFRRCFEVSSGNYLWMFGDDDLPRPGVVRHVVDILMKEAPDFLALKSFWSKDLSGVVLPEMRQQDYLAFTLSKTDFVRYINIWITYISANIVKVGPMRADEVVDFESCKDSKLTQLAWMAPAILNGEKFIYDQAIGVLATAENSGGYRLLEVFGKNLCGILNREWMSEAGLSDMLLRRALVGYMPGLIWMSRSGRASGFSSENALSGLTSYRRYLPYWVVAFPLVKFPAPIARPILILSKIFFRLFHMVECWVYRLRGSDIRC